MPLTCGFVFPTGSFQGVVSGFPTGKMPLGITRGKARTTQETPPIGLEKAKDPVEQTGPF